jgi:hypothetical protein
LFAYCDQIESDVIEIDALLVPVRELMAAATSRILQERIAMAEGPWANWPSSDVNGSITAGAIYSLNPVDEARILAVGFHRLVHWATVRQVPLFLLEFPRTVNDGEYLIETLWPWLSAHCDREQARTAFAAVADPELVRIGRFAGAGSNGSDSVVAEALDRDAMAILLEERDSLLARTEDQLAEAREVYAGIEYQLAEAREVYAGTECQLAETREVLTETERRLENTQAQLAEFEGLAAQRAYALGEMQVRLDAIAGEIDAMRQTLSWRITQPLRRIRALRRRHPSDR